MTRLQITKIASLMYGYGIPTECPDPGIRFSDVPYAKNDETACIVYQGVKAGFIEGYVDGNFKPTRVVSRDEALKILLAAGKVEIILNPYLSVLDNLGLIQNPFRDVSTKEWNGKFILYSAINEIAKGCRPEYFCPKDQVTRAEAIKLIIEIIRHQS